MWRMIMIMMYDLWRMTYDAWRMTYDVWRMTYDVWRDMYNVWRMTLPWRMTWRKTYYDVWRNSHYTAGWRRFHCRQKLLFNRPAIGTPFFGGWKRYYRPNEHQALFAKSVNQFLAIFNFFGLPGKRHSGGVTAMTSSEEIHENPLAAFRSSHDVAHSYRVSVPC